MPIWNSRAAPYLKVRSDAPDSDVLAGSLGITVGEARSWFTEIMTEEAESCVVGFGLQTGVEMGPVINPPK